MTALINLTAESLSTGPELDDEHLNQKLNMAERYAPARLLGRNRPSLETDLESKFRTEGQPKKSATPPEAPSDLLKAWILVLLSRGVYAGACSQLLGFSSFELGYDYGMYLVRSM